MQHQKRRHSRAAHNAPEVSHATQFHSTRPGPHSRSHVYFTHGGSYPQVVAPSAAMAELYTTPGPSASQRPASREKHFALPSSGCGEGYHGSTIVPPPSSKPQRRSRTAHPLTHTSSPAHRPHSNKERPSMDCRRDSDHLHGESRSSTHDQPRLDNQAGTTSENRDIFEPTDYIKAWQGTLQPTIPPDALWTNGVVPTGRPDLADGPPHPHTRQ
jgi:hypothetical protein